MCHFIGMVSQLEIKSVLQQFQELYTQQSAFCQHRASLFDDIAEVFLQCRVADYQSLAQHCAVFSSADVEGICKCCHVSQCHFCFLTSQSTAHSRTVTEQIQTISVADHTQSLNFIFSIYCPDFCCIGNVNKLWFYHMLISVQFNHFRYLLRSDFSIHIRNMIDFVTCRLDGARFVNADVCCIRCNDCVMRSQECAQCCQVCLSSGHQEVDLGLRCLAQFFDYPARLAAVFVQSISYCVCHVSIC